MANEPSALETMAGRPDITAQEVTDILATHYGLSAKSLELSGERDSNFLVRGANGEELVLKLAHPDEMPDVTDLQIQVLLWLERAPPTGFVVPKLRRTVLGLTSFDAPTSGRRTRVGRLLSFVQGTPLRGLPGSPSQYAACGTGLAQLTKALDGFDHPAAKHSTVWDVRNAAGIRPLLNVLPAGAAHDVAEQVVDLFETTLFPRFDSLRHRIVHGDFNRGNVLVDPAAPDHLSGVIDFGDVVRSAVAADVAIGIASQIDDGGDPATAISAFVGAYHAVNPLDRDEQDALPLLIAARMAMSSVIPLWHRANNPGNPHYRRVSPDHAPRMLSLVPEILASRGIVDEACRALAS